MTIEEIQDIFRRYRNEERAEQMSKYMKGRFSFYGIPSPLRREISKQFLLNIRHFDLEDLFALVQQLWHQDQREFQYLAMDMLDKRKRDLNAKYLATGEELVLKKSWWDTTDYLSTHFFAPILIKLEKKHRLEYVSTLVEHENLWLNRVAIIFQLLRKEETETELLELSIIPHLDSKEFFHQKAIGWALRQYSKVNPLWVREFIDLNPLAPLSIREGSKYL